MDSRLPLVLILLTPAVGVVIELLGRRRGQRLGFPCAMRAAAPGTAPLTSRWRHGSARIEGRVLQFRPSGPGGMRFPRGEPFAITVLGMRRDPWRAPRGRQLLALARGLRIVTLDTANGPVELAASRQDIVHLNLVVVQAPPDGGAGPTVSY